MNLSLQQNGAIRTGAESGANWSRDSNAQLVAAGSSGETEFEAVLERW